MPAVRQPSVPTDRSSRPSRTRATVDEALQHAIEQLRRLPLRRKPRRWQDVGSCAARSLSSPVAVFSIKATAKGLEVPATGASAQARRSSSRARKLNAMTRSKP
jgi:hypothetical protein